MTNLSARPCTPENVQAYLEKYYGATPEQAKEAIARYDADGTLQRDQRLGSFAYYAGDKIGTAEGWPYTEDEDEEE
jgi:hypothetical protein